MTWQGASSEQLFLLARVVPNPAHATGCGQCTSFHSPCAVEAEALDKAACGQSIPGAFYLHPRPGPSPPTSLPPLGAPAASRPSRKQVLLTECSVFAGMSPRPPVPQPCTRGWHSRLLSARAGGTLSTGLRGPQDLSSKAWIPGGDMPGPHCARGPKAPEAEAGAQGRAGPCFGTAESFRRRSTRARPTRTCRVGSVGLGTASGVEMQSQALPAHWPGAPGAARSQDTVGEAPPSTWGRDPSFPEGPGSVHECHIPLQRVGAPRLLHRP